jgi:hypothetical protein
MATMMSYEEKRLRQILKLRETTLNSLNKKIENKTKLINELTEIINKEENIISAYLDTFEELKPIHRFRIFSTLVDAKVKKTANKKRYAIQTIQTLKIQRDKFIKQSYHDQCIEIAFIDNDYEKITALWCDKYTNSHNSLYKLFSAFQFFIEDRTFQFIKKFSDKNCIAEHIDCMYGIQLITAEGMYNKSSFVLYHKELSKKSNVDKLRKLLLEAKRTFRNFMIHLYGNYFPLLSDDILEQILDYTHANYFIK